MRDKAYLILFLLAAGFLLYLGKDLLQGSVLIAWGLTFSGTTAVAVLGILVYRLQLQLSASRRELMRKEAELNFAREVQQALFPKTLCTGRGLEFSATCLPAQGISGDYYDVLPLGNGGVAFAITDISGKGISAAILMANIQALLRSLAYSGSDPRTICETLNRHLYEVTDESRFATFFFAEWCPELNRLRYVNAGHNPPILLDGGCERRLEIGGYPLGVFESVEFEVGETTLAAGDLLVLYSDGVTEAVSSSGEEFGEERLGALLGRLRQSPLDVIKTWIIQAVEEWSGGELTDDVTLVLVRAVADIGKEES